MLLCKLLRNLSQETVFVAVQEARGRAAPWDVGDGPRRPGDVV